MLELDENAAVITYEEYYPYGCSSYQAGRGAAEVSLKRYRYASKEKDEETGLYYYGARYHAPWLGRWTAADPAGLNGGINLFAYCQCNPVVHIDKHGTQDTPTTAVGITITTNGIQFGPFVENDLTFTATGSLRRVEMAPHVDEAIAVRGDKAGGVAGSPSDPANKQFLDPRTNTQTKSNFVSNAPTNPRPNVSAAASPQEAGNRLITGRFSEVDEMNDLAADATAHTGAGLRTNTALRASMKADPAIRGALSSVGINPDTLKAENPPGVQQFPKSGTVNLSPRDADLDAATGKVVPGPNTTAAQQRRAASQTPAASQAGGGGGSQALANLRSGTASVAGGVGRMVPGVVETETALTGAAVTLIATAPSLVTPLLTAAEAVPVVAGAAIIGAGAGQLARAGASAAGADPTTANTIGLGAAVLTGAAIGSVIPGVGTAVGAAIGGLVAEDFICGACRHRFRGKLYE